MLGYVMSLVQSRRVPNKVFSESDVESFVQPGHFVNYISYIY